MFRHIVFLRLILLCAPSAFAQRCNLPSGQYLGYNATFDCLTSVPFSTEVRDQTVDMLMKSMELMVFLDIAVQSPDPEFPIAVDILGELNALRSRTFSNDLDFHEYVSVDIFRQLQDSHSRVRVPQCYRDITFYQPLQFVGWMNEGNHVITVSEYIPEDLLNHYQNELGIPLNYLLGAEVLQINGQAAVDVLEEFAQTKIGIAKDRGTRFNSALTSFIPSSSRWRATSGYWNTRNAERAPVPRTSSERYSLRLQTGEIVNADIPWVARSSVTFTDEASFMSRYWASKQVEIEQIKEQTRPGWEDQWKYIISGPKTKYPSAILLDTSNNAELWEVNSETAVLTVDTFSPQSSAEFTGALSRMFGILSSRGYPQLIIDATGNGGGQICLGRHLHDAIFPTDPAQPITEIPSSQLADLFAQRATALNNLNTFWSGGRWLSHETGQMFDNTNLEWWDGKNITWNGRTRQNSKDLRSNCGSNPINGNGYTAQRIILLSNGVCGSTCAIFGVHLRNHANVRTVTIGGYPNRDMQYMFIPGIQVLESTAIWSTMSTLQIPANDPTVPQNVPTTLNFRFTSRTLYSPYQDPTIPVEFQFHPSDVHLDYNEETANTAEQVWESVLPYFEDGSWKKYDVMKRV